MKFIKYFLLSGMMIDFYAYADPSPTESPTICSQCSSSLTTEILVLKRYTAMSVHRYRTTRYGIIKSVISKS